MILLASGSPRRAALLTQLGVAFEAVPVNIDESFSSDVRDIARRKFDRAVVESDGKIVLAADTLVWSNGVALAKPQDHAHASAMVQSCSGETIEVRTAVCIGTGSGVLEHQVTTKVRLKTIAAAAIETYLAGGTAWDKAGALDLQGQAAPFVAEVTGCWTNVVGLPICFVQVALDQATTLATTDIDTEQRRVTTCDLLCVRESNAVAKLSR